ncbi:MAG: SGNH/GDSL hydrolase family protein [Aeromicrobium sp.]
MMKQRTAARTPIVIALALAVLLGPFLARSAIGREPTTYSTIAPRGIVVVGDSITALYNDEQGDAMQGWWSVVGHHYDAHVTTYAQSGSGYLRPGKGCTGDRFIDRQRAFTGDPPSLFIIEGGRNDWALCKDGRFVAASDAAIEHAVDTYLGTLTAFLPRSTRIIVMGPPWGPLDPGNGERVSRIIEAVSATYGLEFIPTTDALTQSRVVDGVHPNRAGSVAIADRVISALG